MRVVKGVRIVQIVALLLGACADRPLEVPEDGGIAMMACTLPAPLCVESCSSDVSFGEAVCKDLAWSCSMGINSTTCPAARCWGSAPRSEQCGPLGWECRPTTTDFDLCPALLCTSCAAFDGPTNAEGCACVCTDNQVTCQHMPG